MLSISDVLWFKKKIFNASSSLVLPQVTYSCFVRENIGNRRGMAGPKNVFVDEDVSVFNTMSASHSCVFGMLFISIAGKIKMFSVLTIYFASDVDIIFPAMLSWLFFCNIHTAPVDISSTTWYVFFSGVQNFSQLSNEWYNHSQFVKIWIYSVVFFYVLTICFWWLDFFFI